MARFRRSRFVFQTTETERIFHHRPYLNDLRIECTTCQSTVSISEPYSHHWLTGEDAQHMKFNLEDKLLLQKIEKNCVDTFILCDESSVARTGAFVLEAGTEAVPQLLRFLSYGASQMEVTIGFFITVTKRRIFFESSPLVIKHFLDIEPTVDLAFTRLVEKVGSYAASGLQVPMEACSVKRIKVIVNRQFNGRLQIPLQYYINDKNNQSSTSIVNNVDLEYLSQSYLKYHGQRFGNFPESLKVNLYCLRVCAGTKEVYAVPYLLQGEDVDNTPTYLIQTDVAGEFRGMHQIRNVRRFLRPEPNDNIIDCWTCKEHISGRVQFAFHKQVDCGQGVIIYEMDPETPELFENCMPLPKTIFKFAWFGIGKSDI